MQRIDIALLEKYGTEEYLEQKGNLGYHSISEDEFSN